MKGSLKCLSVDLKNVAVINQDKAALAGQTISAQGKVVKVNNGIMGRNFVHVQDRTGDAASNNLIVTGKQTASSVTRSPFSAWW